MPCEKLLLFYRFMEWADAAVWRAVLACEAAGADRRIRELLHHLHVVQRAFLRTWREEPRDKPYANFEKTREMLEWARSYYGRAVAHLESLDEAEFSSPLRLPWAAMVRERLGREPEATTLEDTALQVLLHTQYHRGQINARLRELGGEPPLVDYIAWVWLGRPAPEWPDDSKPEPEDSEPED